MSILIKNGRVVTAIDDYVSDIFIEGETVKTIGKNLNVKAGWSGQRLRQNNVLQLYRGFKALAGNAVVHLFSNFIAHAVSSSGKKVHQLVAVIVFPYHSENLFTSSQFELAGRVVYL